MRCQEWLLTEQVYMVYNVVVKLQLHQSSAYKHSVLVIPETHCMFHLGSKQHSNIIIGSLLICHTGLMLRMYKHMQGGTTARTLLSKCTLSQQCPTLASLLHDCGKVPTIKFPCKYRKDNCINNEASALYILVGHNC